MARSRHLLSRLMLSGAVAMLGVYAVILRPWHLRWGSTEAERRRCYPGDGLVPRPWLNATRAITIAAPPAAVWPWLVQMGYRRAGWYSYDRLDNDGLHVHRLIPELQTLQVGDTLLTGREIGFVVQELEPRRHLVLLIDDPSAKISSTFIVEQRGNEQARLIIRLRACFRFMPFALAFAALFDFGDFIMMRKMLLGIKERAEREYRSELDAAEALWTYPKFASKPTPES